MSAEEEQILQDDPCLAKSKVVGDVQYCDRYWECEFGQPELYDCPNGLVWVGKNQGIADGCDYPWRHQNICKNKDLASKYIKCFYYYVEGKCSNILITFYYVLYHPQSILSCVNYFILLFALLVNAWSLMQITFPCYKNKNFVQNNPGITHFSCKSCKK